MTTLKERFAERFTPELLMEMSHRWKYHDAQQEILSFFQQELLALAEEVKEVDLTKRNFAVGQAAALIRLKAESMLD